MATRTRKPSKYDPRVYTADQLALKYGLPYGTTAEQVYGQGLTIAGGKSRTKTDAEEAAKVAGIYNRAAQMQNEQKLAQAQSIYQSQADPNAGVYGAYRQAVMPQLERARTQQLAAYNQRLRGRGMYRTSQVGDANSINATYGQGVANLEADIAQRQAQAGQTLANFYQGTQETTRPLETMVAYNQQPQAVAQQQEAMRQQQRAQRQANQYALYGAAIQGAGTAAKAAFMI